MKHRFFLIAAIVCAAIPFSAGTASATPVPSSDAFFLANTLLTDPARLDGPNTGWVTQPVDSSGVTPVTATTAAAIDTPINGFPAAGKAVSVFLTNGHPQSGYD